MGRCYSDNYSVLLWCVKHHLKMDHACNIKMKKKKTSDSISVIQDHKSETAHAPFKEQYMNICFLSTGLIFVVSWFGAFEHG